ncbi:RTA1-domain-containing protein [Obba rivulosa]|uniref:RTA1-domain-containing protein n=1 Tax=Obba rivulosa TaxID=1052685 RepID=A0A8E2DUY9_9APHY|nr:RTA1-domain-containing protein [Obba rivulosa]
MNSTSSPTPSFTVDAHGHIISPFYGYTPTESVCLLFVVLFGITAAIHLVESVLFRTWFLLPTICLAAFGEILGWAGRLWSSFSPLNNTPYTMQIAVTIIAPTPFVAAIFILFSRIVQRLGPAYSRLSPRLYSRIFFTADFVCLLVQAVGGGIAATANTNSGANLGGNIMLAGIVLQMVSLSIFTVCAAEFLHRFARDRPFRRAEGVPQRYMDSRLRLLSYGLTASTVLLFVRAIYRTVELADGWNGRIIQTQVYFTVFDGTMVVLAMFIMNVTHPGLLLQPLASKAGEFMDKTPYSFSQSATQENLGLLPPA